MFSSCFIYKHIIYVHILVIQLLFTRIVTSMNITNEYLHHTCLISQGNYKHGSKYNKDLNYLIESVSLRKFKNGFLSMSYGEAPNVVVIVVQCRGDSYGSLCRSCYATAIAGFRRRCPRNKAAIIWYDQCFLSVGTIEISLQPIDYENTFSMHNPNNVGGDKELFNKKTRSFLNELIPKAMVPNGSKYVYYAAGEKKLGTKKLYAMVQCAQNVMECKVCLESSIRELSDGKQGARVYLGRSCNVRYELYPFLRTEKIV